MTGLAKMAVTYIPIYGGVEKHIQSCIVDEDAAPSAGPLQSAQAYFNRRAEAMERDGAGSVKFWVVAAARQVGNRGAEHVAGFGDYYRDSVLVEG